MLSDSNNQSVWSRTHWEWREEDCISRLAWIGWHTSRLIFMIWSYITLGLHSRVMFGKDLPILFLFVFIFLFLSYIFQKYFDITIFVCSVWLKEVFPDDHFFAVTCFGIFFGIMTGLGSVRWPRCIRVRTDCNSSLSLFVWRPSVDLLVYFPGIVRMFRDKYLSSHFLLLSWVFSILLSRLSGCLAHVWGSYQYDTYWIDWLPGLGNVGSWEVNALVCPQVHQVGL